MDFSSYFKARKQFKERYGTTIDERTFPQEQLQHLLASINWFEQENSNVVDEDNEEDINMRSIAFGNLRFCGRIKESFNQKIEYEQNERKFYLINLSESEIIELFTILLQYNTKVFFVI